MTEPTIPEVIGRFRDYYAKPGNSVGGVLHIVLEDSNVEDHFVQWCVDEAEKEGDTEGAELGRILLRMSKTQRRKLGRMNLYPPVEPQRFPENSWWFTTGIPWP